MKICPQCQTTYTDDTLEFCLQDGNRLVRQEQSNNWSASETLIKPTRDWEQSQVTQISTLRPEPKKTNLALAVVLTALAMLLLFGGGIGAWFLFRDGKTEIAQNKNTPGNLNDNSARNTNNSGNINSSPSPTPSAKPSVSMTPTPSFNPEQVKSEASSRVYSWKSGLESGNLNAYMSNYADHLDYYFNFGGVSNARVRSDKERAFNAYYNFRVNISNMRVTPDPSGEKAIAVFDKEWVFEGAEKRSAGKVQSQLQLTKIGGQWRITGERDLKIYYTQ